MYKYQGKLYNQVLLFIKTKTNCLDLLTPLVVLSVLLLEELNQLPITDVAEAPVLQRFIVQETVT